jgi:hypothetical protein
MSTKSKMDPLQQMITRQMKAHPTYSMDEIEELCLREVLDSFTAKDYGLLTDMFHGAFPTAYQRCKNRRR